MVFPAHVENAEKFSVGVRGIHPAIGKSNVTLEEMLPISQLELPVLI